MEPRIAHEAAEAFACFMFDKGKLLDCAISMDTSDFESLGQAYFQFSCLEGNGIDIYMKVDFEVNIWELIFETSKRQFCILLVKDKFLSQNQFEWYRILNYWTGLVDNPKVLGRSFNQSLTSVNLPRTFMEWGTKYPNLNSQIEKNEKRFNDVFDGLLVFLQGSFFATLNPGLNQSATWTFRYWNAAKYGYCICFREIEIRLLIHIDRLRLYFFQGREERMWLDLPPENITSLTKYFESALVGSFKMHLEI
tara:strand:+ start:4468 stop:5220 length:753 start_codon:yes stop_codon:yes gene_type:complete